MAKSAETSEFWRRLILARRTTTKPLGLRQQDIAKSTGKRQSAVTKWKTGKNLPTTETVRVLADEAGVSFDWLMADQGEMRKSPDNPDPDLADLIRHWHALDTEGKQYLLRTAKLWHGSQFTGDPAARLQHEKAMEYFTLEHKQANGVHEVTRSQLKRKK